MGSMKDQLGDNLPTIDDSCRQGMSTLYVHCSAPRENGSKLTFDALRRPDETYFIDIPKRQERMREQLRELAQKAREDPSSLTLKDFDEIFAGAATLGPSILIVPDEPHRHEVGFLEPFVALPSNSPRLEAQAILRQAHAMEYIGSQLGKLVRLEEEEAVREKLRDATLSKGFAG